MFNADMVRAGEPVIVDNAREALSELAIRFHGDPTPRASRKVWAGW